MTTTGKIRYLSKKQMIGLFIHAKNLIKKYGWIRYQSGSKSIGFCATGAFTEAARDQGFNEDRAIASWNKWIKTKHNEAVSGCVLLNDKATSRAPVLREFSRMIRKLRAM